MTDIQRDSFSPFQDARRDGENDAPEDPPATGDGGGHASEAEIDEAGDESFPASDAPPWWSGARDEPDR